MRHNPTILLATPPMKLSEGKPQTNFIKTQPIGLLYIGSYLRANGQPDLHIIDGYSFGHDRASIENVLDALKPDIIGITSVTVNFPDAMAMTQICREKRPGATIVLGGVHVSVRPEDAFGNGAVDAAVIGEGEKVFLEICKRIENGQKIIDVRGICFQENGRMVQTPPSDTIDDLDSLPFPDHSLLPDISLYNPYPHWNAGGLFSTVITSRGCPYGCIFCSISKIQGRKYRTRSPENIISELKYLYEKFGIRNYSFRDGTVGANRGRLEEICRLLISSGLDVRWNCTLTIREGNDRQLLELMHLAGCRSIQFGVESGDEGLIGDIKKITIDDVRKTVDEANRAGIEPHGYFMYGLPGETRQTMRNTLKTALKIDFATAGFAVATPYPGTQLNRIYESRGLLKHERWAEYDTQSLPVFTPEHVEDREILQFVNASFRRYYLRPKKIGRLLKKLNRQTFLTYLKLFFRHILKWEL